MKVIVVDDELAIRKFLSRLLSVEGWTVVTAASPDEFLKRIEVESFDLALIDVNLGTEDGIQLARRVHLSHTNLKLILMSGRWDNDDEVRESGFGEMLHKPFDFFQLKQLMNEP